MSEECLRRLERIKGLSRYEEKNKHYGTTKTLIVTARIPLNIYLSITALVDMGLYSNVAGFVRQACRNEVAKWTELLKTRPMLG